jgi:mannose-6-phosphate isomerase-like protein (cupin superfamily)
MIEKISEEWLIRGFSCGLWIDPPGQCWENYKHKEDELFLLLDGVVELEINGEITRPKIHVLVLIPAHTVHSVRNVGEKESRWLYGYRLIDANKSDMSVFNQ